METIDPWGITIYIFHDALLQTENRVLSWIIASSNMQKEHERDGGAAGGGAGENEQILHSRKDMRCIDIENATIGKGYLQQAVSRTKLQKIWTRIFWAVPL